MFIDGTNLPNTNLFAVVICVFFFRQDAHWYRKLLSGVLNATEKSLQNVSINSIQRLIFSSNLHLLLHVLYLYVLFQLVLR